MSKFRYLQALIMAAALTPPAALAAEAVAAELLSEPFLEVYQPEVQVSGNVIVGLMSVTAQEALARDRLAVRAAAEGTEVCVRATTNDGIYSSRNHYRLPEASGEVVRLPYRSDRVDVLSGYAEGDIAISVTLGGCDTAASDTYLVASAMDGDPAEPVRLLLNSFGATDVFVAMPGSEALTPCEYLSEGRRTTYDFVCTLEAGAAALDGTVTIIRERFGREQPAVEFRLAGPAS